MLRQLSFLLLLASAAKPVAGQATLGMSVKLKLAPPAGFCELSDSIQADKRPLAFMRGAAHASGDKLLSLSAKCNQLKDWREGKGTFDDYAGYRVALDPKDRAPSPDRPFKQACARLLLAAKTVSKDELETVLKEVKIVKSIFIRDLGWEDKPPSCYAGLIERVYNTKATIQKTVLTLYGIADLKNQRVMVFRSMPYKGPDTIVSGLAQLKTDLAAFYAAN